jgi:hypothetical protein
LLLKKWFTGAAAAGGDPIASGIQPADVIHLQKIGSLQAPDPVSMALQ